MHQSKDSTYILEWLFCGNIENWETEFMEKSRGFPVPEKKNQEPDTGVTFSTKVLAAAKIAAVASSDVV